MTLGELATTLDPRASVVLIRGRKISPVFPAKALAARKDKILSVDRTGTILRIYTADNKEEL